MPEARDSRRTALADLSGGGFFIRRVASLGAPAVRGARKPVVRRVLSPSSNKENVLPAWAVRAVPKQRSPLPDWYPRTPLRDITAVVKAIERKNRLRNAAARQRSERPEDSLQSADSMTPVQAEKGFPHCTPPALDSLTVAPGSSSAQIVASPAASLAEYGMKLSSSPSDCSLQTPSKPFDPAFADLMEKQLSSSIEQIEKMVRKTLKRTPKAAQPSKRAIQRRTLMSMR